MKRTFVVRRELKMKAIVMIDDIDDRRALEESLAEAARHVRDWSAVEETITVSLNDEVK